MEQLAESDGIENQSVMIVCIGGGGTGKTSTLNSFQGQEFVAERLSTRGGRQVDLLCELSHGAMVGFKPSSAVQYLSRVEHAILRQLALLLAGVCLRLCVR